MSTTLKKLEYPILFLIGIVALGAIIHGLSMKHHKRIIKPLSAETNLTMARDLAIVSNSALNRVQSSKEDQTPPTPLREDPFETLPTPMPTELTVAAPTPVPDFDSPEAAPTPRM